MTLYVFLNFFPQYLLGLVLIAYLKQLFTTEIPLHPESCNLHTIETETTSDSLNDVRG